MSRKMRNFGPGYTWEEDGKKYVILYTMSDCGETVHYRVAELVEGVIEGNAYTSMTDLADCEFPGGIPDDAVWQDRDLGDDEFVCECCGHVSDVENSIKVVDAGYFCERCTWGRMCFRVYEDEDSVLVEVVKAPNYEIHRRSDLFLNEGPAIEVASRLLHETTKRQRAMYEAGIIDYHVEQREGGEPWMTI